MLELSAGVYLPGLCHEASDANTSAAQVVPQKATERVFATVLRWWQSDEP